MQMSRIAVVSALVAGLAASLQGQATGSGYLFGAPDARLSIRAGYAHANAGSDVFTDATTFLTLSKRSFSGPSIGGDLSFIVAPRLDLTFSGDYSATVKESEDREYIDNNDLPIVQTTSFRRAPLTANAVLYLASRGRSVGTLAWIPARVVPWVGAGGGTMWYRFRQEGDFVDYRTLNVFSATLESSGWAPAFQALGGVDVTMSPRFAFTVDLRSTWAKAELSRDYTGYEKIDLSGVTGALGVTLRL